MVPTATNIDTPQTVLGALIVALRGAAVAGYDPLAPRGDRRAALERAAVDDPGGAP